MKPMRSKLDAIFLDRDGVINMDHGHVGSWSNFDFVPGALEALHILRKMSDYIVIVTNQAGIAKGYYSNEDYQNLKNKLIDFLGLLNIRIDEIYHCPHHPFGKVEKYRKICLCRKPMPGMFLNAMRDFNVNPAKCVMIGDKSSDIEAALKAKITCNFLVKKDGVGKWENTQSFAYRKDNLISVAYHLRDHCIRGEI